MRSFDRTSSARARHILDQGFTTFLALQPQARVEALARSLHEVWRRNGEPSLFSQQDVPVSEGIVVSPVGMTVAGLLGVAPEAAELFLHPELLALFGEVLGPGFELELVAGVMSDHTRPFFFWHHHIGGIDGEDYRGRHYPRFERCERLTCTVYATPVDDEHGTMLICPRAISDPTEPPYVPDRDPWPGAVEVRLPAASVVVLEQSTWHAVTPMTKQCQRFFSACFVRRAGLQPSIRKDPSLPSAFATHPRLARAYGGPAARAPALGVGR